MSIYTAVLRDLDDLAEPARNSALAETALKLARLLDDGELEARDYATVARELRFLMRDIRELSRSERKSGSEILAGMFADVGDGQDAEPSHARF